MNNLMEKILVLKYIHICTCTMPSCILKRAPAKMVKCDRKVSYLDKRKQPKYINCTCNIFWFTFLFWYYSAFTFGILLNFVFLFYGEYKLILTILHILLVWSGHQVLILANNIITYELVNLKKKTHENVPSDLCEPGIRIRSVWSESAISSISSKNDGDSQKWNAKTSISLSR